MFDRDIAFTALAPMIWGSTYMVTTLWLPPDRPLTVSLSESSVGGCVSVTVTWYAPQADISCPRTAMKYVPACAAARGIS